MLFSIAQGEANLIRVTEVKEDENLKHYFTYLSGLLFLYSFWVLLIIIEYCGDCVLIALYGYCVMYQFYICQSSIFVIFFDIHELINYLSKDLLQNRFINPRHACARGL